MIKDDYYIAIDVGNLKTIIRDSVIIDYTVQPALIDMIVDDIVKDVLTNTYGLVILTANYKCNFNKNHLKDYKLWLDIFYICLSNLNIIGGKSFYLRTMLVNNILHISLSKVVAL